MSATRQPAPGFVRQRLALLLALPLLTILILSLACNMQTPPYAENQRATDAAVSAQATDRAQTVRATATAAAPSVEATATALALVALDESRPALLPLAERWGLHFVRVPAGEFTFSEDNPDLGRTAEMITLAEFWIGLTEVTNAQYAAFIDAGGYEDRDLWTEDGWTWRSAQTHAAPGCWQDTDFNAPDQPVTCVSWYEATAYAAWLSRETGLALRLPTVEEWEKAARGTDSRRYPWGDAAPDFSLANYAAALGRTAPVGSLPAGASPYGALDMAGNVAEWTATKVDFADDRIVRGGSWYELAGSLPAFYNMFYPPDRQMNILGLRLVVTLD
ncbi:MAG: SUMF1/EgtB/PvdO family nonheme iron enzyme [Chloroflexota bacterium]|nr:SUMF1/EgtB/PvdO family nonheme iron enzyme [Chloroflexota bacterium]